MSARKKSSSSTLTAEPVSLARRVFYGQVHLQATKFGAVVASYAGTVREVSAEIRTRRPHDFIARFGTDLSSYLENAAQYLQKTDGPTLVRDAEGFVETQPVVAVAAAIVLGFASARIVKVSSIMSGAAA